MGNIFGASMLTTFLVLNVCEKFGKVTKIKTPYKAKF